MTPSSLDLKALAEMAWTKAKAAAVAPFDAPEVGQARAIAEIEAALARVVEDKEPVNWKASYERACADADTYRAEKEEENRRLREQIGDVNVLILQRDAARQEAERLREELRRSVEWERPFPDAYDDLVKRNEQTEAKLARCEHALNNCEIHAGVEGIRERTACALCFTETREALDRCREALQKRLDELEREFAPVTIPSSYDYDMEGFAAIKELRLALEALAADEGRKG